MSAIAWRKSRTPATGYAEAYLMTAASHRRFAAFSAACALLFLGTRFLGALTLPLLGLYVLILTLYLASFARGFSEEES